MRDYEIYCFTAQELLYDHSGAFPCSQLVGRALLRSLFTDPKKTIKLLAVIYLKQCPVIKNEDHPGMIIIFIFSTFK